MTLHWDVKLFSLQTSSIIMMTTTMKQRFPWTHSSMRRLVVVWSKKRTLTHSGLVIVTKCAITTKSKQPNFQIFIYPMSRYFPVLFQFFTWAAAICYYEVLTTVYIHLHVLKYFFLPTAMMPYWNTFWRGLEVTFVFERCEKTLEWSHVDLHGDRMTREVPKPTQHLICKWSSAFLLSSWMDQTTKRVCILGRSFWRRIFSRIYA